MEKMSVRLRKWGNSLGVVIPSELVSKSNLEENEEIDISIEPKNKMTVEDVMELAKKINLKRKGNTQKILNEIDKELWPEEK